jgi:Uma2 family endonuclease
MVATGQRVPPGEVVATADSRALMHNVPWSHYEVLLALRGERSVPRLAYLEGTLEIMRPSETHERLKSRIGRLVEVYLLHRDLEFEAVGSWTLKSAPELRGAEPDECYKVGDLQGEVPHLAIEVIWTSGGIDKLAIYERLGIPEVWVWQDGRIGVHVLVDGRYRRRAASDLLPGLDLDHLTALLDEPSASAAIKKLRHSLESSD